MQVDFEREAVASLVDTLQTENDIVRIVDPVSREVLYWPAEMDVQAEEDAPCLECNSVWGRSRRCSNCSSLEAIRLYQRTFKVEINGGHAFWIQSRPMNMDGRPCVLETVNDVTEGLMVEGAPNAEVRDLIGSLNDLIVTDSLTTLYNRRFLEEFEHRLPELAQEGICVNVAMFDLDNLKEVNDEYGHAAGDAVLKDAAGFLKLHYGGGSDAVERYAVRYGGDEFLVVACGLSGMIFEQEAIEHYENMRRVCYYDDLEIPFGMSFGCASSDEFGWDWEALVRSADERMYSDKRSRLD